jgi:cytidine deaminase
MSTPTSFTSAEAVPDKDGLIHGVSAEELQIIGEQCIDAKTRAYCKMHFLQLSRVECMLM